MTDPRKGPKGGPTEENKKALRTARWAKRGVSWLPARMTEDDLVMRDGSPIPKTDSTSAKTTKETDVDEESSGSDSDGGMS